MITCIQERHISLLKSEATGTIFITQTIFYSPSTIRFSSRVCLGHRRRPSSDRQRGASMLSGLPKTATRQSRLRLLANMSYMFSNELAKKIIASFLSVKANLGSERRTVGVRFHNLDFEKLSTCDSGLCIELWAWNVLYC